MPGRGSLAKAFRDRAAANAAAKGVLPAMETLNAEFGVSSREKELIDAERAVLVGIQLWRAPPIHLQAEVAGADARPATLFRQGLLTAASNPKALLFYGAFLPQFIDPARALFGQFVVMTVTFVVIEVLVEMLLAVLAQRIRTLLQRVGRTFNRVCGGLFVAMGLALPMTR